MILDIPCYLYQSETQIGPAVLQLMYDHDFFERMKDNPLELRYTGQHITNVSEFVNEIIGYEAFSPRMNYYMGLAPNEVFGPDGQKMCDVLGITPSLVGPMTKSDTGVFRNTSYRTLNGFSFKSANYANWPVGYIGYLGTPEYQNYFIAKGAIGSNYYVIDLNFNGQGLTFSSTVFDDNLFLADGSLNPDCLGIRIEVTGSYNNNCTEAVILNIRTYTRAITQFYTGSDTPFNKNGSQSYEEDNEDPNNKYGPSGDGGGDGELPPEEQTAVDPTDVPELPSLSASNAGLITLYNPTLAQLQALGAFLWSGPFDPDSFKKVFTDPIQCIIGLGIVPIIPATGGSKNIKFGNVDSGVNCSYLSSQYATLNCGSVKIKKDIGSFLDYTAVKISLYLPYIGFRELSPDDVMGGTISVHYNIDVLTGACAAFVKHSTKGVMYCYNGSCITNVALTGANYSSAIQNAVSTVASGAGVIAGMATGTAPLTAMSAVSMLNSAANTAFNSKPTIQRSGNLGGSAGLLSVKKPFIIIDRPKVSVPSGVRNYLGHVCNETLSLGSCKGYTLVDQVHLEGIDCTGEEMREIEKLLKGGVFL